MDYFYINPIIPINKTYNELFVDLNTIDCVDTILQEDNTYLFFVKFIKKLISNEDFCVLDSDISEFEKNGLKINDKLVHKVTRSEISTEISNFRDLINKIKSSSSQVSIFTSGTTGRPKKITHSISSLTRTVKIKESLSDCRWAFAYNPTHIAGIQVFLQSLFNENTLVDVFKQPRNIINEVIKKYSITHISATPTFYRLLLPFDEVFVNVKRITFGGEKSDSHLYEKLQAIFPNAKITNIYASTELGTLLHSSGEFFTIPKYYSNDIIIKDNELLVNAKILGKSDDLIINDGMYRTGDIVEVISHDPIVFKFKTRISDYINIGGYKVNIQEIEEALNSISGVQMASVNVKTNSVMGNMLIANIVLDNTNLELSEKSIKEILKNKLQDFKIPRIIKFVKELEFTHTGKISKK